MSTEFISILPPPGAAIKSYDRHVSSAQQNDEIPAHFREVMSIREEVYVHEQHVPLENELDDDDPRSWHWITYVSMGTTSTASPPQQEHASKDANSHDRKSSTANRVAAATIRLVPPPHAPHPVPDSSNPVDALNTTSESHSRHSSTGTDSHSVNNPDSEPYIKLARLSTLQPFRKLGLGRLLVDTALEWASSHADEILPPPSATAREAARAETGDDQEWQKEFERQKWRGLVMVHAQKGVTDWWKKRGFVLDEGLGEWDEEGIIHVGMWKRVALKDRKSQQSQQGQQ